MFQVRVDDAVNGVSLPIEFHQGMHTNKYFTSVEDMSTGWSSAEQIKSDLYELADRLLIQAGQK